MWSQKTIFVGIFKEGKEWEGNGSKYDTKNNKKIFKGDYKNGLQWNGFRRSVDLQNGLIYKEILEEGSVVGKSVSYKGEKKMKKNKKIKK